MSFTSVKQDIQELTYEEQVRLLDLLGALVASKNQEFVDQQSQIMDNNEEWVTLEDLKKEFPDG